MKILKKINIGLALLFIVSQCFSQQSTSLLSIDSRTSNNPPTDYDRILQFDFKARNAVEVPGVGSFSGMLTLAPWSDNSGGVHHQLNFNEGGIFWRTGWPDASTWNPWAKMITEKHTGDLEINGKLTMYGQPISRWVQGISGYVFESNHFYGHTTDDQIWIGQNNPVMIRGNLGVGTSGLPWTKFHVTGQTGGSNNGIIRIDGIGATASLQLGINTDYSWLQSHGSRPLRINELGNNTYINSQGGNVGIGTTTADFKLTVNGKIKAEEIQVVVDVPADYVFEDNYNLLPLKEVEQFIKDNKHLPGIPNGETIAIHGWNVGEMNNKLLEKIEELTLHLIELNKVIQIQSKEIQLLKSSIK
ncbi:MAG: hypothetical protein O9262_11660 [Cyclobacteriaceae bacterium]|nr:hypothetical protein [Cyclobacteriaceae bacterium]